MNYQCALELVQAAIAQGASFDNAEVTFVRHNQQTGGGDLYQKIINAFLDTSQDDYFRYLLLSSKITYINDYIKTFYMIRVFSSMEREGTGTEYNLVKKISECMVKVSIQRVSNKPLYWLMEAKRNGTMHQYLQPVADVFEQIVQYRTEEPEDIYNELLNIARVLDIYIDEEVQEVLRGWYLSPPESEEDEWIEIINP